MRRGLLVLGLAAGFVATAAADQGLNFRDAELSEVVRAYADASGRVFLFDDAVRGRITITTPESLSPDEALEVLQAALLLKGFAALPGPAGVRKIVPLKDAQTSAPLSTREPDPESEELVLLFSRLEHATASEVAAALEPLAASGLVFAYPPTNSLILGASETRLRRLLQVSSALDAAAAENLEVVQLRYRPATEAADLLRAIEGPENERRAQPLAMVVDARTNSLLLRGAPERIEPARRFLIEFDRPQRGTGQLHVVPVRNADPEALATLLLALRDGKTDSPTPDAARELRGRTYTVIVDGPTRSLVIQADAATFEYLADVVAELDQAPTRVVVDVFVSEVRTDGDRRLGFDSLVPLTTPKSPTDLVAVALSETSGPNALGLQDLSGIDLSAAADAAAAAGFTLEQLAALSPAELAALAPEGFGGIDPAILAAAGGNAANRTDVVASFTRAPLLVPIVDGSGNIVNVIAVPRERAFLTARAAFTEVRTLMHPHLLITTGEEQQIVVGDNIPIPVASGDPVTTGRTLRTTTNIERRDVGTELRVTATAAREGPIRLELTVDVTGVAAASVAGDVEDVGPTLTRRSLQVTANLNDGEVAVIGGATTPQFQTQVTQVPFLGSIPILGFLFRTKSTEQLESRVLIAAQARRIRTPADAVAETIRRRLAVERNLHSLKRVPSSTPYALRVTTRAVADDAVAIAGDLASLGTATIVTWEAPAGPRHDVYLCDVQSLAALGPLALQIRERGFDPEVVILADVEPVSAGDATPPDTSDPEN
ncbi:MAG: hypothetical protein MJE66_09150 [Proteobacteria bacterium]|nr:hypothetical protein [Pseudomonadota bacterium]